MPLVPALSSNKRWPITAEICSERTVGDPPSTPQQAAAALCITLLLSVACLEPLYPPRKSFLRIVVDPSLYKTCANCSEAQEPPMKIGRKTCFQAGKHYWKTVEKVQGSFLLCFPPSQQPSPSQSLSVPAASLKISPETPLPRKLRQLQEKNFSLTNLHPKVVPSDKP